MIDKFVNSQTYRSNGSVYITDKQGKIYCRNSFIIDISDNDIKAFDQKYILVRKDENFDIGCYVEFDGVANSYTDMVNYGMVLAYQVKTPTGTSSISFTDITFTVNN